MVHCFIPPTSGFYAILKRLLMAPSKRKDPTTYAPISLDFRVGESNGSKLTMIPTGTQLPITRKMTARSRRGFFATIRTHLPVIYAIVTLLA